MSYFKYVFNLKTIIRTIIVLRRNMFSYFKLLYHLLRNILHKDARNGILMGSGINRTTESTNKRSPISVLSQ